MPAVAVASAVWAGEAVAAATVFEALAVVGTVTAAVGMVTGDQNLTKIGSVLGVVGGVGSLASGSGLLASEARTSTGGVGGLESVDATGASAEAASVTPVPGAATVDTGVVTPAVGASTTGAPAPTNTSLINAAAADNPELAMGAGQPAAQPTFGPQPQKGTFDWLKDGASKVMDFATNRDNQIFVWGGMQAAGNLIGGLFDPLKPAQINALNTRAALEQSQTGLLNQQAANLTAAAPAAVTGAPRPSVFRPVVSAPYAAPGILNR